MMMMTFAFVSLNRHLYAKDLYSFIYIITKEKKIKKRKKLIVNVLHCIINGHIYILIH